MPWYVWESASSVADRNVSPHACENQQAPQMAYIIITAKNYTY